jgi:ubiquinone/menaquinone biosynthesis C-methylase UbiE
MAEHVCPASHAGFLSTPLRRLVTDPRRILGGLVRPGDVVLDLGCGPGFFTLPLAQMVGEHGRVIAVDLQPEMLQKLSDRIEGTPLQSRVALQQCPVDTIGPTEPADLAVAFYVLHEVPDQDRFLGEVHDALKPGGRLMLVEPAGHVSRSDFETALARAAKLGLRVVSRPRVLFSRAALLERD